MIKPASELRKTITRKEIIDYLEDYISEYIEKYANEGYFEMCITGMSISVNPVTGEFCRGLHHREKVEDFVWQWKGVKDYCEEITQDFRKAGYKVYDKNHNGCLWVSWN